MKKYLFSIILISSCVSSRYPRIAHDLVVPTDLLKCEKGEPYYIEVNIIFHKDTRDHYSVGVSFQCEENDGARKYFSFGDYLIVQDAPCEPTDSSDIGEATRVAPVGIGCVSSRMK